MNVQFLAIARDPQIIPGVHHYCDEWCDYCRVTARCLEYRCTEQLRKSRGLSDEDPTFVSIDDAAAFTRELSALEGVRTDELDALLSSPPGQSGVETSDPLAELAWDYAERIALLTPPTLQLAILSCGPSPDGPVAAETLLWYHLRIYMKVFRALVARESHAGGAQSEEARGCAKLVLVSIDRSLDALAQLEDAFAPADLRDVRDMLTRLRDGIESRIPRARAYMRIGIDEPAACA
jgi:hypothetical protein